MTEEEQKQQTASPFASTGSPYPLVTAWYYGRLAEEWKKERDTFQEQDPTLSQQRARELAAAKLAWELGVQFIALTEDAERRAEEHCDDFSYIDDIMHFHYLLLDDQDRPDFREVLQDLSGSKTLLTDEQEYGVSLQQEPSKENEQTKNDDLSQFSAKEQHQLSIVAPQIECWQVDPRPEGGPVAYYLVLVDGNPDIQRKQVNVILNVDQQTGAVTVEPYTPQDYGYTIHDICDHENGECIEDDPSFQQQEWMDTKLRLVAHRLTLLQEQLRQQRIAERLLEKKLDDEKL